MLVLSRKIGERIMIGKDVAVTLLEIRGKTVRIGIDAPRTITVNREEIQARDVPAPSERGHKLKGGPDRVNKQG